MKLVRAIASSGIALGGLAALLLGAASAQQAPPAPAARSSDGGGEAQQARFVIKTEKGFIDDPFDIDPAAKALGVLLTDAASFARVDLIDLETGKAKKTIELGDPQRLFERIVFAGGDKGFVLVSRDAGTGKRSAQYYDPSGKPAGVVGPVSDFGVATRADQRFLVAWTRAANSAGETVYTVARHRLDGLARVGKAVTYTATKARDLKKPPLKAIEWQDGYAHIIGQRPGDYDKAKDVRLPDKSAVLDVLTGNFTWEAEIADVYGWAAASELRKKLPGRSLFAVFAPDGKSLNLVDRQGRHGALELAIPLKLYDPTTLQEHEDYAAGRLLFSLAVDPLNPDALARKKKDPTFLDLYVARPEAAKAPAPKEPLRLTVQRLLRAPMDDRPASWVVRDGHAGVLRKHKNFSRGGSQLEVYTLN
jgi:hypothetical protein